MELWRDDEFMGEYIRGLVVKLHLTPEQEVLFKKNYGCTRKIHNELLSKYKVKYGEDSTKIPTQKELNQFLNEVFLRYDIWTKSYLKLVEAILKNYNHLEKLEPVNINKFDR